MFSSTKKLIPFAALAPTLLAFSPSQARDREGGGSWIIWLAILLILLVIFIIIRIWLDRRAKRDRVLHAAESEADREPLASESGFQVEPTRAAAVEIISDEAEETSAEAQEIVPDDLKLVEGIGPKISSLMNAAGIYTFQDLAGADLGRLQQILDDAGIRIADPSTWADQARLAAEGRWQELETLQDQLKGGRRV